MTDEPTLRGPRVASRIALEQDQEVRYWTRKWNVTRDELAEAVERVGDGAAAVARYLGRSEYD